jgi:hypothetical protein
MDEVIQTQKQELVNVQAAVMKYLSYQSQSVQDLWQYINAKNPYGEISPQAFQQAIGDLVDRGKVILNGRRLASE